MRLIPPIRDIGRQPIQYTGAQIYISQKFGVKWISQIDQVISGKVIKKGDDVYKKLFGLDGHNGVDIAAPKGTPIFAAHSGYIVEATTGTSYGTRVALYFKAVGKEWLLIHGHLDNHKPLPVIKWNINDRSHPVMQGDKIGEVDSTGFSNGHHLHFGLYEYKNGIKLNNNNGYQGSLDPWQYVKEHYMEVFQIEGEQTLVIKNLDGLFYTLATPPELYPYVARILGLKDKNFTPIKKSEVEAKLGGDAKAGLTFIAK